MHSIHPTAIVSKECEIEDGVEIGPYCVLQGSVRLGSGVRLISHVCLSGPVTVGEGTTFFPFASAGFPGQDFKFKPGDRTAGVVIGKNTIFREHATVHAATNTEKPTRIGDSVMMMCNSHVGHDATVENRAILVNGAALGGHTHMAEAATVSSYTGVHQFGRIGRLAFISGGIGLSTDVPPFCMVAVRNRMAGLNLIGLRRAGVPRDQITTLREVYRLAFRTFRTRADMLRILEERAANCPPVGEWFRFVQAKGRTICPGYSRTTSPIPNTDDDEVPVA